MKAWRQVTNPHADIRLGKFDASVFAADLGEVLAGRGAVDYREAGTFYSKTYLTDGISRLLIEVTGTRQNLTCRRACRNSSLADTTDMPGNFTGSVRCGLDVAGGQAGAGREKCPAAHLLGQSRRFR